MPFISNEEIERETQKISQSEMLEKKVDQMKQREIAKEEFERTRKFTQQDFYKQIQKARTTKSIYGQQHREMPGIIINTEDANDIKSTVINVLAMPQTDTEKRKKFASELSKSQTINDYIEKNMFYRVLSQCNDHAKFAVVYCLKYVSTNK